MLRGNSLLLEYFTMKAGGELISKTLEAENILGVGYVQSEQVGPVGALWLR